MTMAAELKPLIESLSDFGLCPTEWTITKQESQIYRIENRKEPQFFFKGNIRYEAGRIKWNIISLAGL